MITVTSAISLPIGSSIGGVAAGDATRFAALAVGTALLVAGIALVAWLVRAGAIVRFISESVTVGFERRPARVAGHPGDAPIRLGYDVTTRLTRASATGRPALGPSVVERGSSGNRGRGVASGARAVRVPRGGWMARPCRSWPVVRLIALIMLAAVGSACAPIGDVRQGQTGPVAWEVLDKEKTQFGWTFTVLLRETTGVGIQFATVRITTQLSPESQGMAWYGGAREQAFARRLEPRAEVRETFSAPFFIDTPQHADLEFRGTDDTGKAVRVPVRVFFR